MKSKEFGDTDYSCFKIEQDCHCEDGTKARDAAIHRGFGDADGFVCSLTGSQWIATGYALAMTIIGEKIRSELTFHSSPFNLHSFSLTARFVWPGSATGQDFPRLFITGFFGNQHGSLCY